MLFSVLYLFDILKTTQFHRKQIESIEYLTLLKNP